MTAETRDQDRELLQMALCEVPPPGAYLRLMRERIGYSQADLADVLGFGQRNGADVVRRWEQNQLGGGYVPNPTSWAALRFLLMLRIHAEPWQELIGIFMPSQEIDRQHREFRDDVQRQIIDAFGFGATR